MAGVGISEDLKRVLELGPEAALSEMLDVASSILNKIITRDVEPGEAVAAAQAIVDAVKKRLNDDMGAALSLSDRGHRLLRSRISDVQHQLICKETLGKGTGRLVGLLDASSRQALILSASKDYTTQRTCGPVMCERSAWINECLREQGLPRMSAEEQKLVPVD